ncbi:PREDICTED: plant UBX domain-containing protein 7 [Nicotiana attenuata]|uniref:UBX domain-containing protein n=1 Tax=Nicotiana attenuata TaxID=49451 RepID=A0A314L216_NICAT|nr:PREDICTED: plant UBX domain-containing protein 7 [Nicotiana attenuata]OIT35666.1 plant ubx domain-containing protein 7 [Nicotiana attenuata]
MDGVRSATDQQMLVSSFLEIAVGQTADTARQFLQATSWKLDEAIQLFYIGNEAGAAASFNSPQLGNDALLGDPSLSGAVKDSADNSWGPGDGEDIRPPLPVKREVLYDNAVLYGSSGVGGSSREPRLVVPFRNFEEEMKRPGVWEAEKRSISTADAAQDNLASLYRPPFALMYHGPFEKAKDAARAQNKWLLVNMQSTREFSSHMLNRDTWANEAVAQTIKSNFIFWQVYDDTEEGSKVCTYYKLDSMPVVLVLDPITGQKMRSWRGMVQPETLLEDLVSFMDASPSEYHVNLSHKRPRETPQAPPRQPQPQSEIGEEDEELQRALAASMEGIEDPGAVASKETSEANDDGEEKHLIKKPSYPPLSEEPKGDRTLLCRVAIRFPDGRRLQRNFLRSDSIKLLWSFCSTQLEEAKTRPFRFTQAIPGASKFLEYDSNITFEESGLANSIISFTWE